MTWRRLPRRRLLIAAVLITLIVAVVPIGRLWRTSPEPAVTTTLRDASGGRPLIGSAVAWSRELSALDDGPYRDVLAREFDLLVPENQMKWAAIHPDEKAYDFFPADTLAAFARSNGQRLRGHALVWYGGQPPWTSTLGDRPCADVQKVLHDHITTVVSRYRGVVAEWDVANEVVDDHGELRTEIDPFLKACGEPILADAFRWAHEADPQAILYLNDFGLERPGPKVDAVYALAERLRAKGAPVQGVGFQGHLTTDDQDLSALPAQFRRFAASGLHVAITEADVRVRMAAGAPAPGQNDAQARVFTALITACRNEPACRSFTFWGFGDGHSWTGSPAWGLGAGTPMDRDLNDKLAMARLVHVLQYEEGTGGRTPTTDRVSDASR